MHNLKCGSLGNADKVQIQMSRIKSYKHLSLHKITSQYSCDNVFQVPPNDGGDTLRSTQKRREGWGKLTTQTIQTKYQMDR